MRPDSDMRALGRVTYLVGDAATVAAMPAAPAREPFDDAVVEYLDGVSRLLLSDPSAREYPDVVTFAFWARRASVRDLSARFARGGELRLGRGVAFHVAPSNVPVNFAYSLAAGLMCGNANVVRVPSRDFPQVGLVVRAFGGALYANGAMRPYVALVRYGHEREVNDALSALCDVRVVWGGDATVAELRRSPLPARTTEVTLADRWSVAVIDSCTYLRSDGDSVARGFYNDTLLTDQNACSSPRVVAWLGPRADEARRDFWERFHDVALGRYELQPVSAVGKLAAAYHAAVSFPGCRVEPGPDNLVVRVAVHEATPMLMELREPCGFFYETVAGDVEALRGLLDDRRCQTVAYVGDPGPIRDLVATGLHGADRIVPVGHTMDFNLVWDGYDLTSALTRTIRVGMTPSEHTSLRKARESAEGGNG